MEATIGSLSLKGKCPKCKTELKHMVASDYAKENGITDNVVMCTNCNRVYEVDLDVANDRMIFKNEVTSKYNVKAANSEKSHTLAIVLGYIFSLLGGWIGLIFSLYLQSRESPKAKMHGRIQLCILGFWLVILGLFYHPIFSIIGLVVIIGMIYLIIKDKE